MVNNNKNHQDLIDKLKQPHAADVYFTEILEKCKNLDKREAEELLHGALKNIAEARPEDVHIDVNNENSFKMRALLRFLHYISKKIM